MMPPVPAGDGETPALLPRTGAEQVTAMAHYYRGEMARMVAWRDRLDHTTNWAIAASAAMLSVTLSRPDSHHAVILCCMVIVLLLLAIEARRYRFFEVVRHRVRLLERNYFARLLAPGLANRPSDWRERLATDLECPRFTISMAGAMGNRLRRNYVWIYLTLFVSWWLKVSTMVLDARTGAASFVHSPVQLLRNAGVSYIPGWLVVTGLGVFCVWLAWLLRSYRPEACEWRSDEADV